MVTPSLSLRTGNKDRGREADHLLCNSKARSGPGLPRHAAWLAAAVSTAGLQGPVSFPCCTHAMPCRCLCERPKAPVPSPFWAAGFSFAPSSWLLEVPYCPHLPHLFFGEEQYMLLRMWTWGWDVYGPSQPLAFHQWERSARANSYQACVKVGDWFALRALRPCQCSLGTYTDHTNRHDTVCTSTMHTTLHFCSSTNSNKQPGNGQQCI